MELKKESKQFRITGELLTEENYLKDELHGKKIEMLPNGEKVMEVKLKTANYMALPMNGIPMDQKNLHRYTPMESVQESHRSGMRTVKKNSRYITKTDYKTDLEQYGMRMVRKGWSRLSATEICRVMQKVGF